MRNEFNINLPPKNTVSFENLPDNHAFTVPDLRDVVYIKVPETWIGSNVVNCVEVRESDSFVDNYRPARWNQKERQVIDCGEVKSVFIKINI